MSEKEDVLGMDFEKLYKVFLLLKLEKDLEEEYRKIRFGVDLKFDIYKYFGEDFVIKNKENIIIMDGKEFELGKFWSELENREAICRKAVMENMEDVDILAGRLV